jgi:hypothetical protein
VAKKERGLPPVSMMGIPHPTLHEWLSGKRRPTSLDPILAFLDGLGPEPATDAMPRGWDNAGWIPRRGNLHSVTGCLCAAANLFRCLFGQPIDVFVEAVLALIDPSVLFGHSLFNAFELGKR